MNTEAAFPNPGSEAGAESPDGNSKPKPFQCRYCARKFHRLEHIQRHERTHTKEKPFACTCGKRFSRRDLLLRHEKLVHDIESARYPRRPAATGNVVSAHAIEDTFSRTHAGSIPALAQNNWESQSSVNSASNSTQQPFTGDSNGSQLTPAVTIFGQVDQTQSTHVSALDGSSLQYAMTRPAEFPGDYNLFFDNFDASNFYLPATVFDSELPISLWSRPHVGVDVTVGHEDSHQNAPSSDDEQGALSRFGSRLPSLRSDAQDLIETAPSPQADFLRAGPPWTVSAEDHRKLIMRLEEFQSVLPSNFSLPSRHTLARFFEGYIGGFHGHLPFLHIPSFNISKLVPELVLATAGVGAQYRFESTKGNKLWYAAKAIIDEKLRKWHSQSVADITSSPVRRFSSLSDSPATQPNLENSNNRRVYTGCNQQTITDPSDPRSPQAQARLGTIQALLTLMAMGMWGPLALLREATLIQNELALLVRDHGLSAHPIAMHDLNWEDWILFEADSRTKCIAYCFFNLHSIAYDNAPLLRTSEMKINLPQSTAAWRAATFEEWQTAQQNTPQNLPSFQNFLSRLFSTKQGDFPTISSLGNYMLIHAIIQQIYFVRQASTMASPTTHGSSLQSKDIENFGQVLRLWQIGWEKAPESSLDPSSPYGPVAFSSTALLRLAYIRLYCDLGPSRRLETRNSQVIAMTLNNSPPLIRSPLLSRAVLQAAHALSIPVKIGIKFVAHTQTLQWSMQHSLANLECAFLLSKWLYMISGSTTDLTPDETNLLEMVRSVVGETDMAVSFADEHDNPNNPPGSGEIKQLSVAVVRLWAEIFSGSHHVYPLVKVIGAALESYADLWENSHKGAAV
ncbi:hypothetical protein BGZ60DRAFT_473117 [Tricladium varicosporioides]|nr:hypothetical protein BGZ60DRAFT_473117 [Hymenoscyphus varicosporioides]